MFAQPATQKISCRMSTAGVFWTPFLKRMNQFKREEICDVYPEVL